MALMIDPKAAPQTLYRLAAEGLASTFGYYEAVDYTASRLPRGETSGRWRSFRREAGAMRCSRRLRSSRRCSPILRRPADTGFAVLPSDRSLRPSPSLRARGPGLQPG